ncbi:membrane protein [Polymorphobacter glacialis]|uniref:Membrane protein n=1 Tax=Sandarakinorhabdus glacialis TaxID=1614636 RepID=A0A917E544_9SPHN|nr:hypothetical protein [Polymorphobacter glacialis]GGE01777.1 membrane protein [Polymorphobacter glacialis]
MLAALIEWLSASGLTAWAGSGRVYPIANVAHLLGLVLLLGGIGIVDLRLMGLLQALPAATLTRALTPFAITGFVLMLLSGSTMFAADAASLIASPTFRWKLAIIAVALANAAAFRWLLRPGIEGSGAGRALSAGVSLGAWLTVAVLGRMIAYS